MKTHNNQRRGDQKVIMGNCGKIQCSESLFFITQINTGTAEEMVNLLLEVFLPVVLFPVIFSHTKINYLFFHAD